MCQIIGATWNRPELLETALTKSVPQGLDIRPCKKLLLRYKKIKQSFKKNKKVKK